MAGSTEVLAGLVDSVTDDSEENGLCVRAKPTASAMINILGHAAMVAAGKFVQASAT